MIELYKSVSIVMENVGIYSQYMCTGDIRHKTVTDTEALDKQHINIIVHKLPSKLQYLEQALVFEIWASPHVDVSTAGRKCAAVRQ